LGEDTERQVADREVLRDSAGRSLTLAARIEASDRESDVRRVSGRRLKAGGSQDWLPHCDCSQWLRSAVGGLFLELNCPRMVLAVKGSFAMTNRIMPLTAPGHSLMTADREEEKASLVGRHLCTSRFKVLAIRSNDLSAIWLSAHVTAHSGIVREWSSPSRKADLSAVLEGLADELFAFLPEEIGSGGIERVATDTFADGADGHVVGYDAADVAVLAITAADFVGGCNDGRPN